VNRCLRRSAGFTLIELLVALVLLSLIFLLATSGLHFGIEIWGREGEPPYVSETRAADNLLRRLLSEARPIIVEANVSQRRHVFFFGTKDSVRFVAPMPEHVSVGGFYEVAVYLAGANQAAKRLEISWRLFRREGAETHHATLLKNVADIEFAYFGDREKTKAPRWHDSWHGTPFLPDLIRFRIKFSRGNQPWPDLVVAPMVQSVNPLVQNPETGETGF
jgi:general secretion pathway protein J